jgi:hypothetical protein
MRGFVGLEASFDNIVCTQEMNTGEMSGNPKYESSYNRKRQDMLD